MFCIDKDGRECGGILSVAIERRRTRYTGGRCFKASLASAIASRRPAQRVGREPFSTIRWLMAEEGEGRSKANVGVGAYSWAVERRPRWEDETVVQEESVGEVVVEASVGGGFEDASGVEGWQSSAFLARRASAAAVFERFGGVMNKRSKIKGSKRVDNKVLCFV